MGKKEEIPGRTTEGWSLSLEWVDLQYKFQVQSIDSHYSLWASEQENYVQ